MILEESINMAEEDDRALEPEVATETTESEEEKAEKKGGKKKGKDPAPPAKPAAKNNNTGQPVVKLLLDGTLNSCNITVIAKPKLMFEFYAGHRSGNYLVEKVVDAENRSLGIETDHNGVGVRPKVDLTLFSRINNFDCLTAVGRDGKQSAPQSLPVDQSQKAKKPRLIKLVSPEDGVFVKYDANIFPIELQTFEKSDVAKSRKVTLSADGPFTVLSEDNTVLAENVTRWQFETDANGLAYHKIKLVQSTIRKVKYRLDGTTESVELTLEFK